MSFKDTFTLYAYGALAGATVAMTAIFVQAAVEVLKNNKSL